MILSGFKVQWLPKHRKELWLNLCGYNILSFITAVLYVSRCYYEHDIVTFAFKDDDMYTAFSEILPLLAIGNSPLLKLERICQNINTRSSTIENSITYSTPFANFTSANFEVRSPYRIQLEFKERIFQSPKIKSNIDLPENLDIFGRNINLSPVKQSLNPLQEAVANIAGVISGQAPVKVPISAGERTKSWLINYIP
ncbi:putative plastid-lipid-associated protein [Helianthus annuus]|nr:putative plastid-lipid-associated protein [Helianthus annuus]